VRILIAEDSELLRDATATALRLAGCRVDTASNGVEALERIKKRRPDVLILDVRMPLLDGFGVSRSLVEQGMDIPIILMTANEQGEEWARQIGAQAFLRKPFSTQELIHTIETLDQDDGERPMRRAGRAA